jgi:hypothetical protein
MFRYTWYLAAGLVISFFPFLLNLESFQKEGRVLSGLVWSMGYALIVGGCIWGLFAVVFAALTIIHLRTGWPWRVPIYFYLTVATVGMTIGVWLARRIKGQREWGYDFLGALVVGGVIGVIFLMHFAYRQAKEESFAHRATAAEARYNALEHQMRPHFLFNALNSLAELIESGHQQAAEMTHKLSDLYRMILVNSNAKTSTVKSEVEIARRYLELEELRFGSRLSFSFDVSVDSEKVYLPSLIMQTLVENSVKHGIARSVEGGEVAVEVSAKDKMYRLSVSNTGQPFSENGNRGEGLKNTRARLDLLYGASHRFSLSSDEAGRTVAVFYFTGEKID